MKSFLSPDSSRTAKRTRTRRRRAVLSIAFVASFVSVVPLASEASTATGTMAVTANILDSCTLTVPAMPFGTYSGTALAMTANLSVQCTLGGIASLTASVGSNGGSGFQRNMLNQSTMLPYNLYTQAAHTTVWGDTTNGTSAIAYVGTGATTSVTIYGNIPASSVALPGNYTDSVLVTLTY